MRFVPDMPNHGAPHPLGENGQILCIRDVLWPRELESEKIVEFEIRGNDQEE